MPASADPLITPEMDRRNGRIFFFSILMIYFSAPAVYVGVVQAALCNQLGASAAIANLPAATYLLGQLGPLIFSWLVPHRYEKATLVWCSRIWAALVIMVLLTLITPQPVWVRIAAVSAQGLLQGIVGSVAQIFSFQCLGRGTTEAGRARAMKWTFSLGPVGAVAGSMAAQYILHTGFSWAHFPLDFALIYLMAAPCIAWMAVLNTRWILPSLADEPRPAFVSFLTTSFRGYFQSSALLLLFLAYLLFTCTQAVTPTLALHTREAMGQDPQSVSGLAMVMRFACKAVGGYFLGVLAVRFSLRASVTACLGLCAAAVLWAQFTSGYWYLFAFGLMGAGELGGAYLPAYGLALSPINLGPRNLSILSLAVPAASFAPVLLGALKDRWGFFASLAFAFGTALIGLMLLMRASKNPKPA
jgi:MFS family permease